MHQTWIAGCTQYTWSDYVILIFIHYNIKTFPQGGQSPFRLIFTILLINCIESQLAYTDRKLAQLTSPHKLNEQRKDPNRVQSVNNVYPDLRQKSKCRTWTYFQVVSRNIWYVGPVKTSNRDIVTAYFCRHQLCHGSLHQAYGENWMINAKHNVCDKHRFRRSYVLFYEKYSSANVTLCVFVIIYKIT